MKTKYVKVSVEERLPLKEGLYATSKGELLFYVNVEGSKVFKCLRTEEEISESKINYWLEEAEDREAEMLQLLKDAYLQIDAVGHRMSKDNDAKQGLISRAKQIKELIKEATN